MDHQRAIDLTLALKQHPVFGQSLLETAYLFGVLQAADVPSSGRFYREVPPNLTYINDPANSTRHILRVGRILSNEEAARYADGYKKGTIKEGWERFTIAVGIYDSDAMTRDLRENEKIMEMMIQAAKSGYPHSLLATLQTFDNLRIDPSAKGPKRPLVAIPGAELSRVVDWELAHMQPDKIAQTRSSSHRGYASY